ncbi:hypothetical protein GCM10010269_38400 [Streptomyces humidus]|uniref:DUF5666 domain-containing protein n=1 Tax=Streptomyces humidus TaxID=52259 RepID=A0A918L4N7_9ACTN|nr:hypothetical protein [Streptomyces humidus]GGR95940.1 hypothetical protein GCM10010269_38400 [Streptomyces humidus]
MQEHREPQEPHGPQRPPEAEPLPGPADGAGAREGGPVRTLWRGRSARARTLIAATTVAVLALGGTVAYAATSNGSGGSPSGTPSASSSEGPGGRHGRGGPWFGLGGDAVHGEATVKDPGTGDWVVRVWQRGSVEKADDSHLTVKSEDGVSWTWTLGPDARVSVGGASGSGAAAPTKGDTVFVVGTRSGDTNTADRVLSGSFGDRGRDDRDHGHDHDRHDGFPGHGPWDRGGQNRSPGPMDSGAAT